MNILLFVVALMAAMLARATDYPLNARNSTLSLTNTVLLAADNTTPTTNTWRIESANFHTVVVNITSPNAVEIDHFCSLDGVAWIGFWTNSTTSPGGTFATNWTGKSFWIQQVVTGSNVSGTITYLGGQ